MDTASYKAFHESQMRNNDGSNFVHTSACIAFSILSCILCINTTKNLHGFLKYLAEYSILVAPLVLFHTILAEYVLVATCMLAIIWFLQYKHNAKDNSKFIEKEIFGLTVIRGLTYLITSFAIAAVDFNIFQRYLAKTERFGYSLMDTGVGLFVLCSGSVHKSVTNKSLRTVLWENRKLFSVLVILGAARTLILKELDYQQHVTEYGVHWNFFYTLAVTKLLSICILHLFKDSNLILAFILVAFLHEFMLLIGLESWVFSNKVRETYLSANREGISSTNGYVALYILGLYTKETFRNRTKKPIRVFIKVLVLLCVAHLFYIKFNPASRVLANFGYISFISINWFTFHLVIVKTESSLPDNIIKNSLFILRSINKNGLIFFLISNLLTGFINLVFQTFLLDSVTSFAILNIYMLAIVIFIIVLNNFNIIL